MEKLNSSGENEICLASAPDIEDIVQIQKDRSLFLAEAQGKTKEQIEEGGFLVHLLSEQEIEELLERPEDVLFIVSKENGKVVGYAVGYKMKFWKELHPEWLDTIKFIEGYSKEDFLDDKSVYFRHVASSPNMKGSGAQLSRKLIELSKEAGLNKVLAEILKEPYFNDKSVKVHTKLFGFKEIGETDETYDGREYRWGVFLKELE